MKIPLEQKAHLYTLAGVCALPRAYLRTGILPRAPIWRLCRNKGLHPLRRFAAIPAHPQKQYTRLWRLYHFCGFYYSIREVIPIAIYHWNIGIVSRGKGKSADRFSACSKRIGRSKATCHWAAWEKKPCCVSSLTVRTSRPFTSALTATKRETTLAAALRSLCRRAIPSIGLSLFSRTGTRYRRAGEKSQTGSISAKRSMD